MERITELTGHQSIPIITRDAYIVVFTEDQQGHWPKFQKWNSHNLMCATRTWDTVGLIRLSAVRDFRQHLIKPFMYYEWRNRGQGRLNEDLGPSLHNGKVKSRIPCFRWPNSEPFSYYPNIILRESPPPKYPFIISTQKSTFLHSYILTFLHSALFKCIFV